MRPSLITDILLYMVLVDNARPNIDRAKRDESVTIGLKRFNNWVKSVCISKFIQRRPDTQDSDRGHYLAGGGGYRGRRPLNGRVLDIGCGKGGDMKKWDKAEIKELVGLDIAAGSIEDYKDRLRSQRSLPYETHLYALDCYSVSAEGKLDIALDSMPVLIPIFDYA